MLESKEWLLNSRHLDYTLTTQNMTDILLHCCHVKYTAISKQSGKVSDACVFTQESELTVHELA